MSFAEKLTKFISDAKRVLIVSKKPGKEEFMSSFKITGIGLSIIGLVGLVTFLIFHFILG